nr:hypothetical protein [Tanacetum cinerariifolium]
MIRICSKRIARAYKNKQSAAQLVPKSQGIGRCNNYAMLQINIEIIESFMHTVGYQGVVDKVSDFYRKYLAQPWQTMFKLIIADLMKKYPFIFLRLEEDYHSIKDDILLKYPSIFLRLEEDYHSIKDDIPLEICATDDYKNYEMMFVNIVVLMNQQQLVVSIQGTHRSTPRAHRTPTLTDASPQGKKRKQSAEEINVEEIERMVEGDDNDESDSSKFVDSVRIIKVSIMIL